MTDADDVLAAARARAAALAAGDGVALTALLHPDLTWSTHTGRRFDRDTYVARNTGGVVAWCGQRLDDVRVAVVGHTAVLTAVVTDTVVADDTETAFRMPVTMTWVRSAGRWQCLAGHAGPRLDGSGG